HRSPPGWPVRRGGGHRTPMGAAAGCSGRHAMTSPAGLYRIDDRDIAELCSGYGQHHSPNNTMEPREFVFVTLAEIRNMLDRPQEVEKPSAQWAIFSTLMTRVHAE